MVVFPNIKINLGLRIIGKRPDGYHNIDSCFFPVGWSDVLEIVPAEQFSFHVTGIDVGGDAGSNLCVRAYNLLNEKHGLPPVAMHLHKAVPIGAGLGGGSSDAAFTLKTLNQLFSLNLNEKALQEYAAELGSDCPFFVRNKPMIVSGRGEKLSPASVSLSGKYLLMVYPNVLIPTAEAYKGVKPKFPELPCEAVIRLPIAQWREMLKNDFERHIFAEYPELPRIKQRLYEMGALYAAMSGSGSTIFGIFSQDPTAAADWGSYQTFGTWLP